MNAFRQLVIRIGEKVHPIPLLIVIVALNISWTVTLEMFGTHFRLVAGQPLLDLENVRQIYTVEQGLTLINQYSSEARSLYWVFFILDNIMPPLVFGAFALLWGSLLARNPNRISKWLLSSPLLLIPFGVGLFDWIENLGFIMAITLAPAEAAAQPLQVGLFFVQWKAICLFATFIGTAALLVYAVLNSLRNLIQRSRMRGATQQPAHP
jgi:hypothetical protein